MSVGICVVQMRMFRLINGKMRRNRTKKKKDSDNIGVTPIKINEIKLFNML